MAANFISPLALNGIRFIFAAAIVGGASMVMGQMSLRHFRRRGAIQYWAQ
jgi:hypothetical protein